MKRISFFIVILVIAGSALVGGWAYVKYFKKSTPKQLTFTAEYRNINETLHERGDVVSKKEYMLSFNSSGVVKEVTVKEGQIVNANDVLIALDTKDLELEQKKLNLQLVQAQENVKNARALLSQAEAALNVQESRLAEIRQGTRVEELQIAQTAVNNAKAALTAAQDRYASAVDLSEKDLTRLENAKEDAAQALNDTKSKADVDINNLYSGVKDVIAGVYANANTAVNVSISELFIGTQTSPVLSFFTSDSQAKTDSEAQRILAGNAVTRIKTILDTLPTTQSGLDGALSESNSSLLIIRTFLGRLNQAVNSAGSITTATLSAYKTSVAQALDAINTAIYSISTRQDAISLQKQINIGLINAATSALNSAVKSLELGQSTNQKMVNDAKNAVTEAENNLQLAQDQYDLKKAGATPEGIRTQEAAVRQAQGVVDAQQSQLQQAMTSVEIASAQIAITNDKLEKAKLRAPEQGVVAKIEVEKSEVVAPGQVVAMILVDGYQVQVDLSELDINKVKAHNGNRVKVMFDSIPDKEYYGAVISIDSKEIVKEGDSYYRVNIAVDTQDPLIRAGMKADLEIIGTSKNNVLVLPEIALIKRNERTYVKIPLGSTYKEVEVITGISDGQNIEIVSGISAGQVVAVGSDD